MEMKSPQDKSGVYAAELLFPPPAFANISRGRELCVQINGFLRGKRGRDDNYLLRNNGFLENGGTPLPHSLEFSKPDLIRMKQSNLRVCML